MKSLSKSLLCLSVLFFAASCSMEVGKGGAGNPAEDVKNITLNFVVSGGYDMPSRTRALTNSHETAIENVYALVFDQSDDKLVAVLKGYNPNGKPDNDPLATGSGGNGGLGSFQFNLPVSLANEPHNLVIVANDEATLDIRGFIDLDDPDFVSAHIGSHDYDEVCQSLAADNIVSMMYSGTNGSPIAMSGETGHINFNTANRYQDVTLTRSVARVDVGVGANPVYNLGDQSPWTWDGKDDKGDVIRFKLESVILARPTIGYASVPHRDTPDDEPYFISSHGRVEIAQSIDKFKYMGTEVKLDRYTTQSIYTPESDILLSGTSLAEHEKHISRTAIIVGGQFDENNNNIADDKTSYYRLDFKVGSGLTHIVRNHLYQFNIERVTGHGYNTPEEAYESKQMEVSYNVLDWEDGNVGGSDFEGQYSIDVDPASLTFDSAGGVKTLTVTTDYPEWEIDTAADWLTLSASGGSGTQTITVTADPDPDKAGRQAIIVIGTGLLTINVPVDQARPGSVEIGNNIWATGNVDTWGKVVPKETDFGMLYQFGSSLMPEGSKVAWPGKDNTADVSTINRGILWSDGTSVGAFNFPAQWCAGEGWIVANNPCPAGWSVPTQAQWQDLLANTSESMYLDEIDGVFGRKFVSTADPDVYIFLPSTGYRLGANGTLEQLTKGKYWSATAEPTSVNNDLGIGMSFDYGSYATVTTGPDYTRNALAIRCVKSTMVDPPKYSVTVNNNATGGLAVATPTSAYASQKVTLSVSVSPEYMFVGWIFGGTTITPALTDADTENPDLTFTMPSGNVTVTPVFMSQTNLIGGIRWAATNVAEPGTFNTTPYIYDGVSHMYDLDTAMTHGTGSDGSICPAGWRLPTADDYYALAKSNITPFPLGRWTTPEGDSHTGFNNPQYLSEGHGLGTLNGVNGMIFNTANGLIFFSTSGSDYGAGIKAQGEYASYWSSTPQSGGSYRIMSFGFNHGEPELLPITNDDPSVKMSVRCVQDVLPREVTVGGTTWSAFNVSHKVIYVSDDDPENGRSPVMPGEFAGATALYDKEDKFDWDDALLACPDGWRLPTVEEYEELIAASTVTWSNNYNGSNIRGEEFATPGGRLFFAASGITHNANNPVFEETYSGFYQTVDLGATNPTPQVRAIHFNSNQTAFETPADRIAGLSVRCVKGEKWIPNPVGEVRVNDVFWARTNVAAKGAFATGEYLYDNANQYTWNEATAAGGTGSDGSICPMGWRMPTAVEYFGLMGSNIPAFSGIGGGQTIEDQPVGTPNIGWDTSHSPVNGETFTTPNGKLFFPASGEEYSSSTSVGRGGGYMSISMRNAMSFYGLNFNSSDISPSDDGPLTTPYSVRCVRNAQ